MAEAITLLEQTLADRERVLGADHPDTLAVRISLANAYRDGGPHGRGDHACTSRTWPTCERVLGTGPSRDPDNRAITSPSPTGMRVG